MSGLLLPAELAWRGVNRLRRSLYRAALLRAERLPRPVISVGNVAAGGTGKTPAVIAVCRHLQALGLRVAVLSRGYGRSGPGGIVTKIDADRFGDEPVMIKKSTNVDVIVGSNRYEIACDYLRDNDCDVFVLDDGFQHLRLHRDFDLVIDAPSRFHREGPAALAHADAVVPRRLRTVVPEDLRGRRVFAFSGLADNDQFFSALEAAGLEIAGKRGFPDHHRYTEGDLAALRRDAGALPLVTSGKDAVKIADPAVRTADAEFVIEEEILEKITKAATGRAEDAGPPAKRRKRRKNPLLQRVEYVIYRLVARRVASMSDEAMLRLGTRLGNLARRVLRRRDSQAMRNLRLVYPGRPETELRSIVDECWRHFGREAVSSIRMQSLDPAEIVRRVDVEGAHLVDEGLARGRGVILLGAHFGSWEVAGLATMTVVPRISYVARPLDNELLERDVQQLREKMGAQIIDRRRAARALVRGMAGNGVVGMIPDQAVQPREGILVPFLGRPAWTTPAPAKLALRANATIVFAFCIPVGPRYRLVFEEPIRTDLLEGEERDPAVLTRRVNDVFARRIHERPELWLWMHDRWKATGESEASNDR